MATPRQLLLTTALIASALLAACTLANNVNLSQVACITLNIWQSVRI